MTSADTWGPFSGTLDAAERLAQLRSLRTIVHLVCGPRAESLSSLLSIAEVDEHFIPHAADELNRTPTRDRRRILSAFGALHCPRWNG